MLRKQVMLFYLISALGTILTIEHKVDVYYGLDINVLQKAHVLKNWFPIQAVSEMGLLGNH
jgi:hypothetical protein